MSLATSSTTHAHSRVTGDDIPGVDIFNPEPWHSVASRWYRWIRRFQNFVEAKGYTDDKQKRAMLLHCVGEEVHMIFETLGEEKDLDTYEKALQVLQNYFNPKKSREYEVYTFRQCQQLSTESLDQYYCRLKQLAQNCEFTDIEAEIKSQIVQKGRSSKLRNEALLHPEHSLRDILRLGRTYEVTALHKQSIEQGLSGVTAQTNATVSPATAAVNKVGQYYRRQNQKKTTSDSKKPVILVIKSVSGVGKVGHTRALVLPSIRIVGIVGVLTTSVKCVRS